MGKLPISKEKTSKGKGGFTLVELSIVLVIIGLLIGGILAAQSMISTAKINATVRQIGQFDAMVNNFKTKYNALPGDAPAFGGDGDGVIDMTASSGVDDAVAVFTCEIANFWHDLDAQQFPGSSPCTGPPGEKANTSGPAKNVPVAKIGSHGSFFVATALSLDGANADKSNARNYYVLLNGSQAQTVSPHGWYHFTATTSSNSSAPPADALALDSKMDDGLGNSGNVISGSFADYSGLGVGGAIPTPLATCSDGSGTYQVQNSGDECTPLIRIGGTTGDPQ